MLDCIAHYCYPEVAFSWQAQNMHRICGSSTWQAELFIQNVLVQMLMTEQMKVQNS